MDTYPKKKRIGNNYQKRNNTKTVKLALTEVLIQSWGHMGLNITPRQRKNDSVI